VLSAELFRDAPAFWLAKPHFNPSQMQGSAYSNLLKSRKRAFKRPGLTSREFKNLVFVRFRGLPPPETRQYVDWKSKIRRPLKTGADK
jgi:hypothetical protein